LSLASGGYPGRYATRTPIQGVDAAEARPGVQVFHDGNRHEDGTLVDRGRSSPRVTALAESMEAAIVSAYGAVRRSPSKDALPY